MCVRVLHIFKYCVYTVLVCGCVSNETEYECRNVYFLSSPRCMRVRVYVCVDVSVSVVLSDNVARQLRNSLRERGTTSLCVFVFIVKRVRLTLFLRRTYTLCACPLLYCTECLIRGSCGWPCDTNDPWQGVIATIHPASAAAPKPKIIVTLPAVSTHSHTHIQRTGTIAIRIGVIVSVFGVCVVCVYASVCTQQCLKCNE